jgi:hypothetical protein
MHLKDGLSLNSARREAKAILTVTTVRLQPQDIPRIRIIGLALMPTLSGIVLALGMALRREADQRATVERAFAAQQRDLPYGTVPEKSAQRSVSVRNGSRGAVRAASNAQLDLPLGNVDGKAA